METIFKEGDRVFDIKYGWGVVSSVNIRTRDWPIEVLFDGEEELTDQYSFDGRAFLNYPPTLSFTEYTLNGFSQERPEPLPKKGQIVWVRDWEGQSWSIAHYVQKSKDGYYVTHRDPLSIHLNGSTYRYLTTKNPYANEQ
jgi:hypothetical protein